MDNSSALKLIQDTFSSLQRSGMIDESIAITAETVILGNASVLDSLAFVTFISDLEERICDVTGKEIYLVLNDIIEFNTEQTFLSVAILSDFVEKLANSEG